MMINMRSHMSVL